MKVSSLRKKWWTFRFHACWYWGHLTGRGEYGYMRYRDLIDDNGPIPGNPWIEGSKWGMPWRVTKP